MSQPSSLRPNVIAAPVRPFDEMREQAVVAGRPFQETEHEGEPV